DSSGEFHPESTNYANEEYYEYNYDTSRQKLSINRNIIGRNIDQIPYSNMEHLFPHNYILEPSPTFCDAVEILAIMPVKPEDLQVRDQVRSTWCSSVVVSETRIKCLFLLGLTTNSSQQHAILEEFDTYRDIIQLDFIDSYLNLTLKTWSGLHYKSTRCKQVSWLLKIDSDVFIQPWALKTEIQNVNSDIACYVMQNKKVCHPGTCDDPRWVISRDQYPSETYPDYCNGPAYIMSSPAVDRLLHAANPVKTFFPMEDAYFTVFL
ncbi:unnamed protein product, partial [Meganyctiphanes norvegica]